ncbi:hypothetical protein HUZ36_14405 [Pseudoalteromonas sp. McH1-7]|uniref:hypothetical protein n=1 Tax=unclassified Pseudoalteromonas TaxID=194690 RepID=UPI001590120A|nr:MULTISPECIES: hypothetical protein [unclassified Pseudoalteromonas]NUZ11977.1 hypothetical protein [Pseudoalteromonas sp. McH1-7]USD31135.1 hypothetical protein J8Z24_21740 [Pseudoalteromonas sp. SCSIO 43201]
MGDDNKQGSSALEKRHRRRSLRLNQEENQTSALNTDEVQSRPRRRHLSSERSDINNQEHTNRQISRRRTKGSIMHDEVTTQLPTEQAFMPQYLGSDNHINIGKDEWRLLKRKLKRPALVSLLNELVEKNNIDVPYRMTSKEQAWDDFQALKALDAGSLLHVNYNHARMSYQHPISLLTIDVDNTGSRATDPYFQAIRFTCKGSRVGSATDSWNDQESRRAVFNHILDQDTPFIDRHVIRKALGTRRYIAAQYRPAVAKAIFHYFKPKSVIDMSLGWGDRLLGFEASPYPKRFVGIDPDNRVIQAGNLMHKQLKQRSKKVELYNAQAESFKYEILEEKADLLYFCPPPFHDERYTDEESQAYKRYKTENAFIDHFLVKAVVNAWHMLEEGGVLVLDMGDLRGSKRSEPIRFVDSAIDAIVHKCQFARYIGTIGARINDRTVDDQLGARIDPIWIISKGTPSITEQALFGRFTSK